AFGPIKGDGSGSSGPTRPPPPVRETAQISASIRSGERLLRNPLSRSSPHGIEGLTRVRSCKAYAHTRRVGTRAEARDVLSSRKDRSARRTVASIDGDLRARRRDSKPRKRRTPVRVSGAGAECSAPNPVGSADRSQRGYLLSGYSILCDR